MANSEMATAPKLRIIMLGESGVGKTSLMLRFYKNEFRNDHKLTLIDNYNKTIFLNDTKVELELWDTAGQERFKAIVKKYFRGADGVLLTYDMTNLTTFMKLSNWLSELREENEEATVFIVGNKMDLQHANTVSRSTVEKYARDEGLEFCETSAKENANVEEVFKNLALKVLEKKQRSNGEIAARTPSNVASDSSQQETEISLPPIIRLEDDLGNDNQVINLAMEMPKQKRKKKCC